MAIRQVTRKDGSRAWEVTVYRERVVDTTDPSKERKVRVYRTATTKREAERIQRELGGQKDRQELVAPSKDTFGSYAEHWLRVYARQQTRTRTADRSEEIITGRHFTSLRPIKLTALTPVHIETAMAAWAEAGLAPHTRLKHFRLLSQVLTHAVRAEKITRNPAARVDAPRTDRRDMQH
ncbi:MAG: hypothetical protein ACREQ5_22230, partial [Candidatus Dormibacteria bacterium]